MSRQGYAGIDQFRMVAALMVVAIHTSPLADMGGNADFILTRVICRVAVPFFFMTTGYFVLAGLDAKRIIRFVKKNLTLYALATAIYMPLYISGGHFDGVLKLLKDLIIEGTLYHLWYFPAVITGVLLMWLMLRHLPTGVNIALVCALYAIGLMGDSYYGIVSGIPAIKSALGGLFSISEYTRNGLFYAPIYLYMGYVLRTRRPLGRSAAVTGLCVSAALMLAEGLWLHGIGAQKHDSMYIALLPCMYFLFSVLTAMKGDAGKRWRNLSMLVYVLHPWVIVLVRGAAKGVGFEGMLIDNNLVHFLVVCMVSFALAFVGTKKNSINP